MRRKVLILVLMIFVLCSCGEQIKTNDSLSLNEQTLEQLQLETSETHNDRLKPLNFKKQKAVWFTMMDFEEALSGRNQEDFSDYISELLTKIKDTGFNTVYVHVRPYNDAYYKSEMFPLSVVCPTEYDPFEIILEKSHSLNLSVHAWINPMRCMTDEELKKIDNKYKVKQWYDDTEKNGTRISEVDGRWYLNPAYEEVREFISDGVDELLKNYPIDGIHIDDYFYPTQNENFDKTAFEKSGEENLESWRRENINLMIQEIYNTVKKHNKNILFGISPQGNISINESDLYADVTKWISEKGFCDYIVPQLYYGFKNESKPFKETFLEWKNLNVCEDVTLVSGVCLYKIGVEDKWAGSGKNEWIDDRNIPSRQIEFVFENDSSVAVYSIDSLFDSKNTEECTLISKLLKEGSL
ncbi:MAG: family 10 glycosylhydrolase [Oscillospiraceae bacterium]|nr:family 10 glycosylhydrolase [Oscillospiraceae bacterium]